MPEHTVPAMRRAFNALKNGRPGPVMLEVPTDVMTAEFEGNQVDYTAVRRTRSAGDPSEIDEAAKMLIAAKAPIVIAGQGVLYAEACDELLALADLLELPVMTTTDGKSAFPEDHALALGSGGVVYTGHGRQMLLDCDVILAIGTSLTRHNISTPIIPDGKVIIHLTNDSRDLYKANDTALPILGRRQARAGPAGRGGARPPPRAQPHHRCPPQDRRRENRMAATLAPQIALARTADLPVFRDLRIHAGDPIGRRDRDA